MEWNNHNIHTVHRYPELHFTYELSSTNNTLNFLDLSVSINNKRASHKFYQKDTLG